MKVPARLFTEQVTDGVYYQGYVEFVGERFYYELKFSIPISQLGRVKLKKDDVDRRRQIFQLTIKKGFDVVELEDDEYMLFFNVILPLVDEFRKVQVQEVEDSLYDIFCLPDPIVVSNNNVLQAVIKDGVYDLPPEYCWILCRPKFGCRMPIEEGLN